MGIDQRRAELSQFLRTRRLRLSPKQAGLQNVDLSRRRTKGLRREEVATLAGISLPWYTQLEQGRDIHVSDQVLESLARVLRLDADERKHLFFLAGSRQDLAKPVDELQDIPASPRYMVDQFSAVPAYVYDEKMNVLAWNRLAEAVFGSFDTAHPYGRNLLWRMFTLPSRRSLYPEWESLAKSMLDHFRPMYVRNLDNPWYKDFIDELKAGSPEAAEWWDHHGVQCTQRHPYVVAHPEAGRLHLDPQIMHIEDQKLYLNVFVPNLNDGSDRRLAVLNERDVAKVRS
jgi:transcriptional regulator with XRE-family HTH domain